MPDSAKKIYPLGVRLHANAPELNAPAHYF
jgi:hypothetical protein